MSVFSYLRKYISGLVQKADTLPRQFEHSVLSRTAKEKTRQICVDAIALCFDTSTAPDGTPWRPLKYRTGKPLVLTWRLRSEAQRAAKDMEITGRGLLITQSEPYYYRYQLFGTSKIPARPWLGISEVALHEIEKVIGKDMQEYAVQWFAGNRIGGNIINRR
jgi:phage gpG-like protein